MKIELKRPWPYPSLPWLRRWVKEALDVAYARGSFNKHSKLPQGDIEALLGAEVLNRVRGLSYRHLVDWEKLPEETKELNRAMVRRLPATLAEVGLQVIRTQRSSAS